MAFYVKKHFIPALLKNKSFIKKDYKSALYETFLEMDVMVQTKEGVKELKTYKSSE